VSVSHRKHLLIGGNAKGVVGIDAEPSHAGVVMGLSRALSSETKSSSRVISDSKGGDGGDSRDKVQFPPAR